MPRKTRFRRGRLTLTSLIDVIFLLLLFFMLSSTFTRFAEVNLTQAGQGGVGANEEVKTQFVRLNKNGVTLNGDPIDFAALTPDLILAKGDATGRGFLSIGPEVQAQLFVDALARMQAVPEFEVVVLQ
ncbi:outer membrane transport energization protein ExbD [Aliiroseovarius halocynthiae]|uniref:Biopolymer transporter ExbD n=1 Tax=Aliiroseovarius halocynthiae TaxID=985055 RepID=A0A545SNX0_9RHOB|nr:biopolymer transporter ExbD [Aliiroseovarius halocynthiae]TQV66680.1 biopolymer transporter ExbD [Aliiroseovarius halocynthiae]SMR82441.1 outer membrane transport energization protein ExbD [Aliiroseovarius halocynthiae]